MSTSIPSVPRLRLLGKASGLLRHRPETLRTIAAEYGDCVFIPIPGRPLYLLSSPAYVRQVLQTNQRNWKGFDFKIMRSLLGDGLITSHGETWKCGRAATQPSFQRERIESCSAAIVSAIQVELDEWQVHAQSTPVMPALELSLRLSLRVFTQALFGIEASREELDEVLKLFEESLRYLDRRLASPFDWVGKISIRRRRQFTERKQALEAIIEKWVSRRRQNGGPADFLSDILREYDQDLKSHPAAAPLMDHLITFLVAGHETTATCLAWTLYLLAKHPSARENMRAEISSVLGGKAPNKEDLSHIPSVRKSLQESMRLYPPVWSIGRDAIEADLFKGPKGDFRLPPGAAVLISPYIIHRKRELWENSDAFNPERFATGGTNPTIPFSYFPFSGGPRHCVGEKFAMSELEFMLTLILQRFDISPAWSSEPEMEAMLSLRPRPDILIRFAQCAEG